MSRLLKQRSWSPDSERDEAWLRRKGLHRHRRSRSVTDEDLDELRGCIDLGFGFDGPPAGSAAGRRLSETFPALDLYYAVHRRYHGAAAARSGPPDSSSVSSALSVSSSSSSSSSSSVSGESPVDSPVSFFSPDDTPEAVKARLKQWAQVVACSLRQRC